MHVFLGDKVKRLSSCQIISIVGTQVPTRNIIHLRNADQDSERALQLDRLHYTDHQIPATC